MSADASAEAARAAPRCPICGGDGRSCRGRRGGWRRTGCCRAARAASRSSGTACSGIMFERLGTERFADDAGDPVQPRPDARSAMVQSRSSFRSTARARASTSRRSTGLTAPTTSSPARMCWSMSPTTAQALDELLRITAPRRACSTSSCPTRSARRRRATGALRSRRSTAISASTARDIAERFAALPTGPAGHRLYRRRPGDGRARRLFPAAEIGGHDGAGSRLGWRRIAGFSPGLAAKPRN